MNAPGAIALDRRRFGIVTLGALVTGLTGTVAATAQDAGSWTFLVMGLDTREEDANQRSDIIMLARVDAGAGTVRVLSIPRDLWVEIPGNGWHKINAAYQIGLANSPDLDWQDAAAKTIETIIHNFGLVIDGTALTDMNRFPAIIDAVGGIEVDNPYELVDPNVPEVNFPAGTIRLSGDEALVYTSSRSIDGDGGRVMRQHLVLAALMARLQQPGMLARIPALVGTLAGAVRTDIGLGIQAQLVAMLPDLSGDDLMFTNIDSQLTPGWSDDGQWIYEADWATLPAYVNDWLEGVSG